MKKSFEKPTMHVIMFDSCDTLCDGGIGSMPVLPDDDDEDGDD